MQCANGFRSVFKRTRWLFDASDGSDFSVLMSVQGRSCTAKNWTKSVAFGGPQQHDAFLAASRILVNLLPLTVETQGIMNRNTLGRL